MSRIKSPTKNVDRFLLSNFEQNLSDFVEGRIPCELITLYYPHGLDPRFDKWLKGTADKTRDCLESLYSDHTILPAPVLLILGTAKRLEMTRPQSLRKDKKQRLQDVKALDAALKLIRDYNSMLWVLPGGLPVQMPDQAPAEEYLKGLIATIDTIRPQKESDIEMRFCAQTLAAFFNEITGRPLHEIIGSLLVQSLGWARGKSDLRLAALQRAKGPAINARRLTLQEALDLQHQNYGFWRERKNYRERKRQRGRGTDSTDPRVGSGRAAGETRKNDQGRPKTRTATPGK